MRRRTIDYLVIVAMFIVITLGLLSVNFRKSGSVINQLLLENIECLARTENPQVSCFQLGSVDCPAADIKVLAYW